MRRIAAAALLAVVGCAHAPKLPGSSPAQLVIPGIRLFHEVALTLPDQSEQTLLGIMTFSSTAAYTLRAETPLGIRVFEVGHDGVRPWAEVTAALEGRFPALGLAEDVRRIYFAGCPPPPLTGVRRCRDGAGLEISETLEGAPARVVRRGLEDRGGRRTDIRYERWAPMDDVVHPERIVMRSEGFEVRILLTGFERL